MKVSGKERRRRLRWSALVENALRKMRDIEYERADRFYAIYKATDDIRWRRKKWRAIRRAMKWADMCRRLRGW